MPDVGRPYPLAWSDEEILGQLVDSAVELEKRGFDINAVLQLTPIMSVGQSELVRRAGQRNAESAERIARSSRQLAIVAVVIAVATLLVTVGLAVWQDRSSRDWQNEQTRILVQIRDELRRP